MSSCPTKKHKHVTVTGFAKIARRALGIKQLIFTFTIDPHSFLFFEDTRLIRIIAQRSIFYITQVSQSIPRECLR